jgi:gliding motility-associated-like protein
MFRLLTSILVLSCCLTASGQLTGKFTADKTGGCGPLVVHFTNQSTGPGGAVSWQWDLGNGNSSAVTDPVATYTQPGSYMVTLTVQAGGQTSTASQVVTVYQQPAATFTVSATQVCSPTPIQFTSTSTAGSGAITNYLWDFGDGSTASGALPATGHSYAAAGVEGVSLMVTDAYGCTSTKVDSALLTILPRMQVGFTEDNQVLCTLGSPVQFTNTSTGPGTLSYVWSMGDGGTSTQTNPSYLYSSKGTYTVVLTATSSLGCAAADTQTNVLNVANFQAGFGVASPVCAGTTAIFGDQSTPAPTSEQWMVDGVVAAAPAMPPMSYTFPTAGVYTVTLTDYFGTCKQVVTHTVTVNSLPVIPPFDMVQQGYCGAPESVTFTDHTPGAVKWYWVPSFNSSYEFQDTVTGGPSNTIPFVENDIYDVQLTVVNAAGCKASAYQLLSIYPPQYGAVETDGGPDKSCGTPLTKSYAGQTPGQLVSYTWYFGDGTTSTSPTPTHLYSAAGIYNPFLAWTDIHGCTGESSLPQIVITTPFTLSLSANDTVVCVGQALTFTSPPLYYDQLQNTIWSFGDGNVQDFNTPSYTYSYSQPGLYTVSLQETDIGGCSGSVTKTNYITVVPGPLLEWQGATNTCSGTRGDVTFSIQVTGADSLIWNFGDGTTQTTDSTVTTLVHAYTVSGNYNPTITATNGHCSQTVGEPIYVALKTTSLTLSMPATVCPDGTLTVDLIFASIPGIYFYNIWGTVQFQYGDSTNYQGNVTLNSYDYLPNEYIYTLQGFTPGESGLRIITNTTMNCYDTSTIAPLVVGGAKPGYEIVQDDQCYQQPVVLMDTSKVAGADKIVSWLWSFGDGSTSTQSGTVSHLYANPGSYTVKLAVQDVSGCTSADSTQAQVTVNGPEAAFTIPAGTVLAAGSTVQFNNTTNIYGTTNVTWLWQFGDGTSSTSFDPTCTYAQAGTYVVTLTATDAAGGCTSVATMTLVIQNINTAFGKTALYVTSGNCPPLLVQFNSYATNYSSIAWNFGDGDMVSNVANPSHVYAQPGKYIVTFTVTELNGQTVTTVDSVVVAAPVASLQAAVPAICVGQADTLRSTVNQGVVSYAWDFGDGYVGTDSAKGDSIATHVYTTAGAYVARLVVADSLGCQAAAAATDAIDVHAPPIVGLTPPDPLVCLGKGVTISAIGGVTYSWSPGASLSDSMIAAPVASPAVNTVYTVTVADDIGCTGSDSIRVRVVQPETVQVSPDSTAICLGKEVPITATGAYSYSWIGSGLNAANISNPVASPSVSTVYRVAGSDSAGCFSDTVSVIVTVLPVPTVNAGPDLQVLAETPVTIPAVGSPDVVAWLWTPSIDLSCTNCAQPVCTPKQTQQYIVTVTAADGCMASDTVVVKLLCDEAKVRIPDAFTPNGDGHNDRFTVLGAISVVNHMAIYDRWGVKVFEADHFAPADPGTGWDGTMHGQPAPPGVYVYYAEMQCPGGGVFIMKGTVVLIR